MSKYDNLKTSKEFLALMKSLYFPPSAKVEEIEIPKMKFLSFEGRGAPASANFQLAIQSLYGIAYTIKMGLKFGKIKKPTGYFDYKVPPLEGLWWAPGGWENAKPSKWQWELLIMMPAYVTQELIDEAVAQARVKRPMTPYPSVRLIELEEGQAIQIMHVGPYSDEKITVERLMAYAKENAEKISGHHHEIYLSDPRRAKPERIRTVLRYAVA